MSARPGLVGKNPPGPICGHLGPIFPRTGKMKKTTKKTFLSIFLGGPMGPIQPVDSPFSLQWQNFHGCTKDEAEFWDGVLRDLGCGKGASLASIQHTGSSAQADFGLH